MRIKDAAIEASAVLKDSPTSSALSVPQSLAQSQPKATKVFPIYNSSIDKIL